MKRIAIKSLVFLLLGAVTTVAVAWICAANARPLTRNRLAYGAPEPIPENLVQWWYAWGEPSGEVLVNKLSNVHQRHVLWGRWCEGGVCSHVLFAMTTSFFGATQTNQSIDYEALRVREYGWPFRAMRDAVWLGRTDTKFTPRTNSATFHYSLVLATRQESAASARVLPLQPIWSGAAGNTAIYAGAWWLLIMFVSGRRTVYRMRRGRCLQCGYDRRGDYTGACPECGWQCKGSIGQ